MNRFDELLVGSKKYSVISHVNSGNSYSILKVQDIEGNKYYLTIIDRIDDVQTKVLQILQKQHKNIVGLIQIGPGSSYKYILSEYFEIDLYSELKKQSIGKQDFRYIMASISDGISFLHDNNIIHKNLKPESIFIQQIKINSQTQNFYKIGNLPIINNQGSPFFMPPEVIKNQGYDKSIDIWALGAIAYEIIAGKPLFNGKNPEQIQQLILLQTDESIREKLKILPVEYQPIIQKMLSINPQLRPDIKEVLRAFRMTSKSPQRIQTPIVFKEKRTLKQIAAVTYEQQQMINQQNNRILDKYLKPGIQGKPVAEGNRPQQQQYQPLQQQIPQFQQTHQWPKLQNPEQPQQILRPACPRYFSPNLKPNYFNQQQFSNPSIKNQQNNQFKHNASFEEDNHYRPHTFGLQQ